MKKYLFLLIFLVANVTALCQTNEIDSLQDVIKELSTEDTLYVDALNDLGFKLSMTDQQASIYYINLATAKAKELNYQKGLVRATTIKGNSFLIIGLPDQALTHYFEALAYGAINSPIDYVRLHNNIGEVYRRKEVYDSSLKFFNKALDLATTTLHDYKPVIIYSNLGEVSLMLRDISQAKAYFDSCLSNALATNNLRGAGYGYFGLAECANETGLKAKAIQLMQNSIAYRLKSSHQRGLIQSYLKMGAYYHSNNGDSAVYYWQEAEALAKEKEALDLLVKTYEELYGYHLNSNNVKEATAYLREYKTLSDSIRNAEFIGNVELMQSSLQAQVQEAENKLLKEENKRRSSEEDARLITIVLAFIIIFILGINTFQNQQKKKDIGLREDDANYTKTLLLLSRKLNKPQLNFSKYIKELLRLSRAQLNCDRATYWSLNAKKETIFLHTLDEDEGGRKIPIVEFERDQFPKFFNDFLKERTVAVDRISKDPRLTNIYESYFKIHGIESIINAPIFIDGDFFGFVSYAMRNQKIRNWSVNEERFVGSVTDLVVAAIEKQKRNLLKKEKEELIDKLRSRNESLKEFNSVVSHNLREPLTQIIGLSDVLKSDSKAKISQYREIVPKIFESSQRVDKVVKELSTVLNESDPKPSDFRWLSIDKIFKETLDLLKAEIDVREVEISQQIKVEKIHSFKPYLIDIFYHLLSNSLKFSDSSKKLQIALSSYEDELHYYLRIIDNGLGMDLKKFGDKIFKMYQRYHLKIEGRGIGLFIVKNRVNAINGSISVQSTEGDGSTFIIELPKRL